MVLQKKTECDNRFPEQIFVFGIPNVLMRTTNQVLDLRKKRGKKKKVICTFEEV